MIFGSETISPLGPTKDVWKLRTMSMKKTTSTTLSTTSRGMSAIVLDRKAALYGTMTYGQVRCDVTQMIYDVIQVRHDVSRCVVESHRCAETQCS